MLWNFNSFTDCNREASKSSNDYRREIKDFWSGLPEKKCDNPGLGSTVPYSLPLKFSTTFTVKEDIAKKSTKHSMVVWSSQPALGSRGSYDPSLSFWEEAFNKQ